MFEKIKNNLQKNKFIKMLAFVVAGTQSESKFALIPEKDAQKMLEAEPTFILIGPVAPDANGNVQVVATTHGIHASNAHATANPVAVATESAKPEITEPITFVVSTDIPLPPSKRGGGNHGTRVSKYPFATTPLGGSFFVSGASQKSFGSTISNQNKKMKGVARFTLRPVVENDVAGVRVWHIAPKPEKSAAA